MLLAAAALLLSGCGQDRPPAVTVQELVATDSMPLPADRDSARDELVQHGLLVPIAPRAEVAAQLGPPDSSRAAPVANRHDPRQTDSIVQVHYPGMRLEYYVVTAGPGEMLSSAHVRHNRYLRYPSLGVGARREDVLRVLGDPGAAADTTFTYDCRSCMGAESPVIFHLTGGRVQEVEYSIYVD